MRCTESNSSWRGIGCIKFIAALATTGNLGTYSCREFTILRVKRYARPCVLRNSQVCSFQWDVAFTFQCIREYVCACVCKGKFVLSVWIQKYLYHNIISTSCTALFVSSGFSQSQKPLVHHVYPHGGPMTCLSMLVFLYAVATRVLYDPIFYLFCECSERCNVPF